MSNVQPPGKHYFILAGELSGDNHGAALMEAMLSVEPAATFSGIGGERMQAVGLKSLYHADQLAVMGFSEVLRMLPFLRKVMRKVVAHINVQKPDRVILIDYPGFNLRLAERLRRTGIPVTYYISPQLWAWRAGRIKTIRSSVDQLLVIFPFEVEWYKSRGVKAEFVGHPILEEQPPPLDREEFRNRLKVDEAHPILALYPGSRVGEVGRHINLFLEVAALVKAERPDIQIILGLAKGLSVDIIPESHRDAIHIEREHPRLVLRYADVAIVASGTATLEGAVWGVPQVIVYKMSAFSAFLGRWLARLPYYSMVNILAGRGLAHEFLQERAQAGPIAKSLVELLNDDAVRGEMIAGMDAIRESLVPHASDGHTDGASLTAARLILEKTDG